jgi:DGQHR domain-containing protein
MNTSIAKYDVRLEGALCVQRGTPMLQTYATADLVTRQSQVDVYDDATRKGYQRAAVRARMRNAAAYYEKGGRMPNPLLINIREDDYAQCRVVITGGDQTAFDQALADGGNWLGSGFVEFNADLNVWIYDGQHRAGGLRDLLDRSEEFDDFPVPVSLTLGLATSEEMREFYEVNTNAASVKTDLAWQLLSRMAEDDPELQELLAATDRDWIVKGNAVVRVLEELDGPWKGRFQAANQRKRRGDGVVIPGPQFVRSLKPVLDMPLLKRAEVDTIATIVNAYWTGVAKVLPEPFQEDPNDYVIQKGQGTVALHRVLPQVIEVIRANGSSKLGDPDGYAEVLENLPTLTGDAVDKDGQIVTHSGAEFWKVGSVASGFSGDAGRRRLGLLIQSKIPAPSDTISL